MPSGKQSKRQRRVEHVRRPPPVGKSRRRQASPKTLIAIAVVIVLVGIAIGLGVAFSGGGGGSSPPADVPARGTLAHALPEARQVHKLLAGIPQQGNVLGSPKAKVTLEEYIDLQCPYCQEFETQVFPDLVKRFVRTGKVRVAARPLAFIGPDSVTGRKAALAAGLQNHFFDFAEILYFNQGVENTGWLNENMIEQAAASIPNLDVPKLLSDRSSSQVAKEASGFDADGTADNVDSTPTLLVGPTGGKLQVVDISSPTDEQAVVNAIQLILTK